MSSPPEHDDLLADAWPENSPPSREDIREELEDHLACSAAEFAAMGLDSEEAVSRARVAFGDTKSVTRELYWIHHGRRIMAQRIALIILAIVSVGLIGGVVLNRRHSLVNEGRLAAVQKTVNEMSVYDVPVRITVVDAAGQPVPYREIYIWSAREDETLFEVPNESTYAPSRHYDPKPSQAYLNVRLPMAFEVVITDAEGVTHLGRRAKGTLIAAIDLQSELSAKGFRGKLRAATDQTDPLRGSNWAAVLQRRIEVEPGREPIDIAVRLPTLRRTQVEVVTDSETASSGRLWFMARETMDGQVVWVRGEESFSMREGAGRVRVPLPPDSEFVAAFRCRSASGERLPSYLAEFDTRSPLPGDTLRVSAFSAGGAKSRSSTPGTP